MDSADSAEEGGVDLSYNETTPESTAEGGEGGSKGEEQEPEEETTEDERKEVEEERKEVKDEDDTEEWETEDEEDLDFEGVYSSKEDIEETPLTPKRSVPDVEGAIPKTILRKLPNSTIRKIITHVKKHILLLETENYLYEKTIEKLEASEKEIESKTPHLNTEEFEEYMKKARVVICSSESEEEPEDTGEYEPVHAVDEIRMSQDSFFENMSDNSKDQAIAFFRSVEDMAPANYDVMRHKYGDYVGSARERIEFGGEPGIRTRLNTKILNDRVLLDEKISTAAAAVMKTGGGKSSLDARQSVTSAASVTEEDALADFSLGDAKRLSITDRLRFALEEEDEFRNRFYHHETQALKDESAVQIHIDAHKHALGVLMGIRKDFGLITKGATGTGLSGKHMAELLLKFRRKMRNQLSAEETRARITVRKVMAQKKRTLDQLKVNKEAGRSISHIDFEYLLCESSILEAEINGMNNTLQHLKDLTAHFHLVLHDEKHLLETMSVEEGKMNHELKRRHALLHNFHESYLRYRQQIIDANLRMDDIKKKLSEMQVPQPLDYIRLKSQQHDLEREVRMLERRLEANLTAIKTKRNFTKRLSALPGERTVEEENQAWLNEIKREVYGIEETVTEPQNVTEGIVEEPKVQETADGEEARLSDSFSPKSKKALSEKKSVGIAENLPRSHHDKSPSLQHQVPEQQKQHKHPPTSARPSSRGHSRFASTPDLLLAPRRFNSHKSNMRKSKVPVYDLDFDVELDNLDPTEQAVLEKELQEIDVREHISQRPSTLGM